MTTQQEDPRRRRVPTGTGESGSIIQEYFPTQDARAATNAGHLEGPPHVVSEVDVDPRSDTREDLNVATHDQRLQGLVVQLEADLATHRLLPEAVRYVLEERLSETGIGCSATDLDDLEKEILSVAPPHDLDHAQPGAERHLERHGRADIR